MRKFIIASLIIIVLVAVLYGGFFWWKNLRGVAPALAPPSQNITELIPSSGAPNAPTSVST